jgi:hypothetical protein
VWYNVDNRKFEGVIMKVKCIGKYYTEDIIVGKEYDVMSESSTHYAIKNDKNYIVSYLKKYFTPTKEEVMRVRCINNKVGKEGKVSLTIGKIYEYIAPISGVKQGNFDPFVTLVAPTKLDVLSVIGGFNPTEKTKINFEWAMSQFDQNTFSSIDDENNKGQAGTFNWQQKLFKENLETFAKYQFIQKDFKAIERLFNIEFNRDWQVFEPIGNQSFLQTGFNFANKKSTKKNDITAFYGF